MYQNICRSVYAFKFAVPGTKLREQHGARLAERDVSQTRGAVVGRVGRSLGVVHGQRCVRLCETGAMAYHHRQNLAFHLRPPPCILLTAGAEAERNVERLPCAVT